jgi:hypothetical protein
MSPDSDDLEAGIQRHMDNWVFSAFALSFSLSHPIY